jgi:hypothetical protein
MLRSLGLILLGLAVFAVPAAAADIEISYTSLERIIVERMMTEGGRYYMEGTPSDTCQYAFVQEPKVDSEGGRLRIRVLFAGSAGKLVGERCVGLGDNFDLEVTGVPTYSEGVFFLDALKIQAPDTAYFKIVAPLIEKSMAEKLRYPLRERLDYAASWVSSNTSSGKISLDSLQIEEIEVGEASIRIVGAFKATLKP